VAITWPGKNKRNAFAAVVYMTFAKIAATFQCISLTGLYQHSPAYYYKRSIWEVTGKSDNREVTFWKDIYRGLDARMITILRILYLMRFRFENSRASEPCSREPVIILINSSWAWDAFTIKD
jgi:hypothetical protein